MEKENLAAGIVHGGDRVIATSSFIAAQQQHTISNVEDFISSPEIQNQKNDDADMGRRKR
ncbi:hypothetical protein NC653_029117 [Populus alba x Populus x berolinensis]|uniref:Uncharacterized protein n=1 Tax=Populus alba x Populus x berolinensis TaxID=444605 RepID=A0AAD6Q2Z5_9ROSI|nr:hypothetical protein NC653_029117 [Populus alba x Populus x berolinensis]